MTDDEALSLFGTTQPPAPYRILRAGALTARLENGNLRYVSFEGVEILRAISYVVRDRDWGTLAPRIEDMRVEEGAEKFTVSYDAVFANAGATLKVSTRIEGSADGCLRYSAKAFAEQDFETNRCGFNILHPIRDVAGAPVEVEHCDGSREETAFPELIEPWQPFKNIRALTHWPAASIKATCRMEGDVFEMEDQRNWSDASYKTYVRPLALPWPYILPGGQENQQEVELLVERTTTGVSSSQAAGHDGPVTIEVDAPAGTKLPDIGLLITPEESEPALNSADRLFELKPKSILLHFDPTTHHEPQFWGHYKTLQDIYPAEYDLEYVVACEGDLEAEFEDLARKVSDSGLTLNSLAVCPSVDRQSTPPGSDWPACPPLEDIYRAARRAFPRLTLGGGMFSYFTELNRKRPPLDLLDFVTHSTSPIVHAADDDSVMETLETLPHITRSARAIIGADTSYRIGPSTIGMRMNPYGSRTFDNPDGERICMTSDDPRQRGAFAAAWTVGYAARIAAAGIEKWIPAAFTGPRGVLTAAGDDFLPVGRAIAELARVQDLPLRECKVSDERKLAALGFDTATGCSILIANLTSNELEFSTVGHDMLGPFETRWL
ncbi:hypothetical protein [uncultured Roseibium sp.]|uniref:D-apionate lactonase n=1 Tax=uncultured Roseibium sp. TaxID=1936171 RepID=UPI00262EE03E|nr:hypothetical protein [uncultured Roseibium sp.]